MSVSEARQYDVRSMSTLRNNPISIASKDLNKIYVMNFNDNLDLVDEASKSSEYTQIMPDSR